jgi:RNA polymerase sigma-70 factor (ECF subfamily)
MDDFAAIDAEDAALVARARDGDAAAFGQLVRRHQGRIRAWLAVRIDDPSLADDLAQDAFVIAFERLASFDAARPFYLWLRGIALNVLRNQLRKRAPRAADHDELQELIDARLVARAEAIEGDGDADLLARLRRCLAAVSGSAEATLRAHYFERSSLEDIANAQGRTAAAIGMILMRARRWLRGCIERAEPQGDGDRS